MVPVNNLLNRINNTCINPDASAFKKIVGTRVTNLFVIPMEICAVAQSILLTPVYAATTILKGITKAVALITGSQTLKNFEAKLPGFSNLLRAIARIVAYSIGTALTATLGFISPQTNFNVHCGLGLAIKHREAVEAIIAEMEAEEVQRELEEEIAQQEAEKKAQEIQRAKEQEALDNLATTFTTIDELEKKVEEPVQEAIHFIADDATKATSLIANDVVEAEQTIESVESNVLESTNTEEEIVKNEVEEFIENKKEVVESDLQEFIEAKSFIEDKQPALENEIIAIENETPTVDNEELVSFTNLDTSFDDEEEIEIPSEAKTSETYATQTINIGKSLYNGGTQRLSNAWNYIFSRSSI